MFYQEVEQIFWFYGKEDSEYYIKYWLNYYFFFYKVIFNYYIYIGGKFDIFFDVGCGFGFYVVCIFVFYFVYVIGIDFGEGMIIVVKNFFIIDFIFIKIFELIDF